ncbi:hypothetical protein WA026_021113 [Henosepilachna vigintioctopunctata]|uniref:Protein quiver n=1 Tax=Henosepilachna vigintioctopunctata TaxID=420089 RepID=A0AAW1UV11_9CUCU
MSISLYSRDVASKVLITSTLLLTVSMPIGLRLFIFLLFVVGYDSADYCMKCDDNNPISTCMLGGDLIADEDDECPPGKSSCYRMKYVLNSNGDERVQRGCDSPNFCIEQRQRGDIHIRRCVQCDTYYCNKGSLKYP